MKDYKNNIDQFQQYFLNENIIKINEVNWNSIINWVEKLTFQELVEQLNRYNKFIDWNIFDKDGLSLRSSSNIKWDDIKVKVLNYPSKWIIHHCDYKQIGIKSNKENVFTVFNIKTDEYSHDLNQYLGFISKVIAYKNEQENYHKDRNNVVNNIETVPFPTIQPGKIQSIYGPDTSTNIEQIKNILSSLEKDIFYLSPQSLERKSYKESSTILIQNPHLWETHQVELAELLEKESNKTIIFLLNENPLLLYTEEKITEKLYRIIESSKLSEYTHKPILQNELDQHQLEEIFNSVWSETKLAS